MRHSTVFAKGRSVRSRAVRSQPVDLLHKRAPVFVLQPKSQFSWMDRTFLDELDLAKVQGQSGRSVLPRPTWVRESPDPSTETGSLCRTLKFKEAAKQLRDSLEQRHLSLHTSAPRYFNLPNTPISF